MTATHREPVALPAYVLVTPARNEARFIESTIQAVVAQTAKPLKWAIVSDGSTDGTDDIVSRYAALHPWMELVRTPERSERHFAGKALAVRAGVGKMEGLPYTVLVSLDGDITFETDYFAFLLEKLAGDAKLGVVGTPYKDTTDEMYDYRFVSTDHVSGACQMFRRECFEEIGGYVLSKGGAIDTIATLTARSKGWKTRTFTEKIALHQRVIGTAENGPIQTRFVLGKRDWAIGNHPLWEIFRGLYQMTKRPILLRGMAILAGYGWAAVCGAERPVPRDLRAFRRREQMQSLTRFLRHRTIEERPAEGTPGPRTQAAG
ncbi:MAG TPA: glycosyltransferase family 2 protein [Terracidiphilus sp.]|jgi:glycosyltransferase involved in cell wall biosynthesis|nr:glycosyltransferase family 2 protein [Terracidiphilus sp.]